MGAGVWVVRAAMFAPWWGFCSEKNPRYDIILRVLVLYCWCIVVSAAILECYDSLIHDIYSSTRMRLTRERQSELALQRSTKKTWYCSFTLHYRLILVYTTSGEKKNTAAAVLSERSDEEVETGHVGV